MDNLAKKAKKKPRGKPFQKGQAPVSPGRPKMPEDIKIAFRDYTQEALDKLVKIMRLDLSIGSANIIARACETILNRGWGTAPQNMSVEIKDKTYKVVPVKDDNG